MLTLLVDSQPVRGFDEIRSVLMAAINKLLKTHASAHIYFCPENNLGNEASHMEHMLRKISRCTTVSERGKQVFGVRTTHDRKVRPRRVPLHRARVPGC